MDKKEQAINSDENRSERNMDLNAEVLDYKKRFSNYMKK